MHSLALLVAVVCIHQRQISPLQSHILSSLRTQTALHLPRQPCSSLTELSHNFIPPLCSAVFQYPLLILTVSCQIPLLSVIFPSIILGWALSGFQTFPQPDIQFESETPTNGHRVLIRPPPVEKGCCTHSLIEISPFLQAWFKTHPYLFCKTLR